MPAELRREFEDQGVVITRGFKNYLHLYTKKVWDEQVESRLQGDILSEETADLNVQFRMGKSVQTMDAKQGRIAIEQHLLDYAGIEKEIIAVRAGQYWRIMPKT